MRLVPGLPPGGEPSIPERPRVAGRSSHPYMRRWESTARGAGSGPSPPPELGQLDHGHAGLFQQFAALAVGDERGRFPPRDHDAGNPRVEDVLEAGHWGRLAFRAWFERGVDRGRDQPRIPGRQFGERGFLGVYVWAGLPRVAAGDFLPVAADNDRADGERGVRARGHWPARSTATLIQCRSAAACPLLPLLVIGLLRAACPRRGQRCSSPAGSGARPRCPRPGAAWSPAQPIR